MPKPDGVWESKAGVRMGEWLLEGTSEGSCGRDGKVGLGTGRGSKRWVSLRRSRVTASRGTHLAITVP